ncbi:hypothetical protein ND748_05245 [Frankia sp. AiPs1]|uniref:hypothetical protein n=1 Tax=Frankia sp. AiPs1 TaxID=573493 RepID=UPI0020446836|nr:hypothetical protein [Frankia sp. AiPs1]MCM3921084.1 hypothetical protein [Frankia sp. AiPs1]
MPGPEPLIESALVDLGTTSLAELRSRDDQRLQNAMDRIIENIDGLNDRFSGFSKQGKLS